MTWSLHLQDNSDKLTAREEKPHGPTPPLLLVHGNAGTGKSHVIDVLSQLLQRTFQRSGDEPDHPYILRLALTGNAASLIKGQTLHSAFQLPFANNFSTLGDKMRDLRRKQLQNLKLIIIDEISLVKSDMLYQINFRLAKDIKQNDLPFGNVALVVFGDLLQIQPPMGRLIFEPPMFDKAQMQHALDPLWKKFSVISLKTNHRQGEDKDYADLLNRVRIGKPTKEDIDLLNTRVFPRGSPDLPEDALISGTNTIVNEFNKTKLNLLPGELYTFPAKVFCRTNKEVKPPIGTVV